MSPSVEQSTIDRLEQALARRSRKTLEASRRAAVAVLLRARAPRDTEVLVIERTRRPDDPWSGHMALPGGRVEPDDDSPLVAARREALEEVGVDLERSGRLLGASDDLRAMARGRSLDMVITPFVFELDDAVRVRALILQEEEVAGWLWAPLEALASGRHDGVHRHERPGKGIVKLPSYEVGGKVIWGLTYMMLRNLLSILEPSDGGDNDPK